MSGNRAKNTVWLSTSATSYACLCEECLETVRRGSFAFLDAVRVSVVRGTISPGCMFVRAHCHAGHEIVLRRGERPDALTHADERQLQLT